MAKINAKKAEVKDKPKATPKGNIVDYLNWLTWDKKKWDDLTYEEKKNFNVYIVNRFLSMNYDYCETINDLQELTCSMEKEMVWRLYYELLPKQRTYSKYIKTTANTLDLKTINCFKEYFTCTDEIASDYIDLLKSKGLQEEINKIIDHMKKE